MNRFDHGQLLDHELANDVQPSAANRPAMQSNSSDSWREHLPSPAMWLVFAVCVALLLWMPQAMAATDLLVAEVLH